MLDKLDLNQKIKKKRYKQIMPLLRDRLFNVQKASWDAQLPVVILFEGWDAAGKGTSIQMLTRPIDPRGYKLYPIRAARTYEKKRPWLWRFWLKIPACGEWAIFDRSWYGRVMVERVEKLITENEWRRAYRDIVDFERALADDNHLIIKFFLHISKQEQNRRFNKLSKDPLNAWHVSAEDWDHHRHYDEWLIAYEEAFERTETEWGPWTIVEATNRRFTTVKIYQTIISALEERLGWEPIVLPPEYEGGEPSAEDELETDDENDEFADELEMEELEEAPSSIDQSETPLESPHANADQIEKALAESEDPVTQASTEQGA